MEYFNIKRFQENKKGIEYNFALSDGTEIRQIEYNDSYSEIKSRKDSPFESRKQFYKSNGMEWGGGQVFYGTLIGIWKEYDSTGKLVKETDFEKPYKKSIYDIAKIMLDSFEVDIMKLEDPSSMLVSRGTNPRAHYQILYRISDTLQGNVTIDAASGRIIAAIKQTQKELEEQKRKQKRFNPFEKDAASSKKQGKGRDLLWDIFGI